MTIRRDLTAAWSTAIPTTRDTVVQCRRGVVFLNFDASAPVDTRDGFLLATGEAFVVRGGNSFRLSAQDGLDHEVWFAEFTA